MLTVAVIIVLTIVVAVVGWLRVRRRPGVQMGMQVGLALWTLYRQSRRIRRGRW